MTSERRILRKQYTVIPFTHPETQMPALVRPLGCAAQQNSFHAAALRLDGGRRRGLLARLRH